MAGRRFTGIDGDLPDGSTASPPECAPPIFDGITRVPFQAGGSEDALVAKLLDRARQNA